MSTVKNNQTEDAAEKPNAANDSETSEASQPKKEKIGFFNALTGFSYVQRAVKHTYHQVKLPLVREGLGDISERVKGYNKGAIEVDISTLPPTVIRSSLLGHLLILAVVIPCAIFAAFITAEGFGLLFRHGLWLPHGQYGTITGPIFLVFAAFRVYLSTKSATFFWQVWQLYKGELTQHESND